VNVHIPETGDEVLARSYEDDGIPRHFDRRGHTHGADISVCEDGGLIGADDTCDHISHVGMCDGDRPQGLLAEGAPEVRRPRTESRMRA
jgi:hypothetical protein